MVKQNLWFYSISRHRDGKHLCVVERKGKILGWIDKHVKHCDVVWAEGDRIALGWLTTDFTQIGEVAYTRVDAAAEEMVYEGKNDERIIVRDAEVTYRVGAKSLQCKAKGWPLLRTRLEAVSSTGDVIPLIPRECLPLSQQATVLAVANISGWVAFRSIIEFMYFPQSHDMP